MRSQVPNYHGYRFPPEIISHAIWLYHRFGLSFRDVEDLLAQRDITVTYETIRQLVSAVRTGLRWTSSAPPWSDG
jgi:transposase-like protein